VLHAALELLYPETAAEKTAAEISL